MNTEKKKYIILFAVLCVLGAVLILTSEQKKKNGPQPVNEPGTVSTLETTKARLASSTRRVEDYQLSDDTVSSRPRRFRDQTEEKNISVPEDKGATSPAIRHIVKTIPVKKENKVVLPSTSRRSGFNDGEAMRTAEKVEIPAVVQQTVDVSDGSTVQLRITKDYVYSDGIVRANTFLTGTVAIKSGRVTINIPASDGLPALETYDTDGICGLKLSDSVKDELRNDAGNTAIDVTGEAVSSSIQAPLLGRVVSSAVSGLKKKTNNYRITLEKGQKVILKG